MGLGATLSCFRKDFNIIISFIKSLNNILSDFDSLFMSNQLTIGKRLNKKIIESLYLTREKLKLLLLSIAMLKSNRQ